MRYQINLVYETRVKEKKAEMARTRVIAFTTACFGLLILSLFYSTLEVFKMQSALNYEKEKLAKVEREFKSYKATQMIVNKADIELLDRLQNNRIFWTKKLAAMARHLPENYWVTRFLYDAGSFRAYGFGYISKKQEQLITLNDYFNKLRADTTYNNDFKQTHFVATERKDEGKKFRVSFEFFSQK